MTAPSPRYYCTCHLRSCWFAVPIATGFPTPVPNIVWISLSLPPSLFLSLFLPPSCPSLSLPFSLPPSLMSLSGSSFLLPIFLSFNPVCLLSLSLLFHSFFPLSPQVKIPVTGSLLSGWGRCWPCQMGQGCHWEAYLSVRLGRLQQVLLQEQSLEGTQTDTHWGKALLLSLWKLWLGF